MISCSSTFKSKIGGSVRYLKAFLENDSGTAEIKSYVLKTGGMGAERFNFGTVYIPEACIITTEQLTVVKNEKIRIRLYVNDEKYDDIDGIDNCVIADLYANGSTKSGDLYTVTAYGYLYLNDPVVAWSATEETVSFSDMIAKIKALTGKTVTIKGASLTENQIQSIVSGMKVTRITEQPTVRAYLSQMAESLMGYAYESVTGEFVICHGYPSSDTTGMEANVLLADVKQNFSISRLTCVLTEGYTDDDGNFTATTSLSFDGTGDSAVKYRGYTTTEEQFNMLKMDIMSVQYAPGTLTLFGNPLIEPSDAISFTDGNGETQFMICAGEITQTFNGGLQTEIIAPEATSDADQQALDDEYTTEETERQNKLTYVKADQLAATNATVQKLYAETAKMSDIEVTNAVIKQLDADTVKTASLSAEVAKLGYVTADTLDAQYARLDKANIVTGWIDSAMIGTGVVGTVQIADGSITDAKIVDLTANKITAGTLSVERLEIRGTANSIVYALNNITGALQAQNVDTLNGEILTPRSITADRIVAGAVTANEIASNAITAEKILVNAITADKLNISDLSSISAKIGGWDLGNGYFRDTSVSGKYCGISRTDDYGDAFFAGATLQNGKDGNFRVDHNGILYAERACLTGGVTLDGSMYFPENYGIIYKELGQSFEGLNIGLADSGGSNATDNLIYGININGNEGYIKAYGDFLATGDICTTSGASLNKLNSKLGGYSYLNIHNQDANTISSLINKIIGEVKNRTAGTYNIYGSWKNHSYGYAAIVQKATYDSSTIRISGTIYAFDGNGWNFTSNVLASGITIKTNSFTMS